MRKDNAIFFVAGLAFGILLGYFVFQSVAQPTAGVPATASAPTTSGSSDQPPARRLLDHEEVAGLERLLERNPDDNEIRIRIGNLYFDAGHYDEAIPYFQEAIARSPKDPHLRNHLALAYTNLGRVDQAVAAYEAILEVAPADPQGLLGLGRVKLYAQQDIHGGLEAWEELLRVAPNSPEADSIRDELEALKSAHSGN
jgi:tetratricopeptide (TPR) repeat protein